MFQTCCQEVFRNSPVLCILRLDQCHQILQVHKEPSAQIHFKKKKKEKLQEYPDTKLQQHPNISGFFDYYTCIQLLSSNKVF